MCFENFILEICFKNRISEYTSCVLEILYENSHLENFVPEILFLKISLGKMLFRILRNQRFRDKMVILKT